MASWQIVPEVSGHYVASGSPQTSYIACVHVSELYEKRLSSINELFWSESMYVVWVVPNNHPGILGDLERLCRAIISPSRA